MNKPITGDGVLVNGNTARMDRPHCEKCGQFISYERATINGKLEGPPMVGWVEWWEGLCAKCEALEKEHSDR